MKNRVTSAPTNLPRRFEVRLQSKRRGQALLLAVVVMLFVALISAGFLATVSGNLNQTARTSEKNRAIEAARAGMAYINNRINTSAEGENWRPILDTPVPLSGAPTYNTYFTPLARVQGWVTNESYKPLPSGPFYKDLSYVPFPNPSSPTSGDEPRFYAKVQRIALTATERGYRGESDEAEHAGQLKITVIGLGKTDPNVFHRMVTYRGGYEAAPVGRVAKVVSNFDFVNKKVPFGELAAIDRTGSGSLTLQNVQGAFPFRRNPANPTGPTLPFPFTVLIGSPDSTSKYPAVVQRYQPDTNTLYFAENPLPTIDPDPAVGTRVEISASVGAPTDFDEDRDTTTTATTWALDTTTNSILPSLRANGSIWWQGNLKIGNLKSSKDAFAPTFPALPDYPRTIQSSGLVSVTGDVKADAATTPTIDVDAGTQPDNLITDGLNRIKGDLAPTRQTKAFSPPDLTSEANLARYRGLTRDSKSSSAGVSTLPLISGSANYGYGQGIYLDNNSDREKKYDSTLTTTDKLREMSQAELMDMWLSPNDTEREFRAPVGEPIAASNATDASLEEKHLRGWIAPDEFHPRGVLVELYNDGGPKIAITRDARSDVTPLGPDADKSWKSTSAAIEPGVYRKVFDVSSVSNFNGVIFAEGNVRIKGQLTGLQTSLTIVSLGNIYIEGSIGLDGNRKILLLARKNVVVNPTSIISRVEGFTEVGAGGASGTSVPVTDSSQFQVGDWIRFGTALKPYRVSDVDNPTNTLTLDSTTPIATTIPLATVVRSAGDIVDPATTLPYSDYARLTKYDGVLQRRIPTNGSATKQIVLRHGAEQRKAASLEFTTAMDPLPTAATMTVKKATDTDLNDNVNISTEKSISITRGTDVDTSDLRTSTLSTLAAAMNSTRSGTPGDWSYDVNTVDTSLDSVPSFMLAGVGNRKPVRPTTATAYPWYATLLPAPNPLQNDLFLGTSVQATFAGATEIGTSTGVTHFGVTPLANSSEDTLTSDLAFYSPSTAPTYTIDPRTISAIPTNSSTFGFKLSDQAAPFLSDVDTALNKIPAYNLLGMKLEDVNTTTGNINNPALSIDINAFVYAQTGSWIVIPGDYFDSKVHGDNTSSYFDLNGNNAPDATEDTNGNGILDGGEDTNANGVLDLGEYVDVTPAGYGAGDFADLNHNGVKDAGIESNLSTRYARYNYDINFVGSIAENYTPIINTTGTGTSLVPGAVADWMNKWANYSTSTGPGTGGWKPINYTFDSAYVLGTLNADPLIDPANIAYQTGPQAGFYMPVADDITYQE